MRTTLKVAELASFLYAFLFFGSFCINALYYLPFGVSITAYMSMSEILLLFLGQPMLYIPVILSLLLLLIWDDAWPASVKTYKSRYAYIADTDDLIVIGLSFFSVVLLLYWYDISIQMVMSYLMIVIIIWMVFIPSQGNAILHYCIGAIGRIPSGIKEAVRRIRAHEPIIKKTKRAKKYWKDTGEKNRWRYRQLMFRSSLLPFYKRFITMAYGNKTLYLIILTYVISIITMGSLNYMRAEGLKLGELVPEKSVSLVYTGEDGESVTDLLYIGETNNFVFLYQPATGQTHVIRRDLITEQKIEKNKEHKSYMEKRFGKTMTATPYELFMGERAEDGGEN